MQARWIAMSQIDWGSKWYICMQLSVQNSKTFIKIINMLNMMYICNIIKIIIILFLCIRNVVQVMH